MRNKTSILQLSRTEIHAEIPDSICEHSIRHASICEIIGQYLHLPQEQLDILKYVGWAHDIGGLVKIQYADEHKTLLQLEFKHSASNKHGSKPSFNPALCIEHAKTRVKQGLRSTITQAELSDPFPLYKEEFELLKGASLTSKEELVLRTWWYHALYSVELLQKRNITLSPEIEVLIRCNEQPWLLKSEPMLKCASRFSLTNKQVELLLAIVRAADILENGNNKERRELRGVSIEDFATTVSFIEYKFKIDGLAEYVAVIDAVKELLAKKDKNLLNVIFAARKNTNFSEADLIYVNSLQKDS